MQYNIISIVGARPQFIKTSVVGSAFGQVPGVSHEVLHTGQHYDEGMSAVFFREMRIREPAYNLGVGSGTHGQQTGRMLEAIEQVLMERRPDGVVVYGDTNSTLAGAIAAQKLRIPVAHVEAGLRSFNREMPEELNRVLTDHASDILFTPTDAASQNLEREGISKSKIFHTGDVMYDAALHYRPLAETQSRILSSLSVKAGNYILATVHRAENTDRFERLRSILSALAEVAKEISVIVPLHPRTRAKVNQPALLKYLSKLRVIEPVGYFDMLVLEKNAAVIVTDSGGVQKEAYFQRVPCVTVRTETEWVELVETGWNRLCNPEDAEFIQRTIRTARSTRGTERELYGGGNASNLIAQSFVNLLKATR